MFRPLEHLWIEKVLSWVLPQGIYCSSRGDHESLSGTRTGMDYSIPEVRKQKGNEYTHTQNLGRGRGWENRFHEFRNCCSPHCGYRVSVSVLLFGSCHLILLVSSTNSFQIVRRQCRLQWIDHWRLCGHAARPWPSRHIILYSSDWNGSPLCSSC